MRTITGRFVHSGSGKPAIFGKLHLELLDEDDDVENIVPLGELEEKLRIPLDEGYRLEWREERKTRGWTDEEIATDEAVEFKQEYEIPDSYDFSLDGDGRTKPGTQIIGNDELSGNTSYHITVAVEGPEWVGFNRVCFEHRLRITGDLPVDLNEIVREPEVDPDAHLSPRERELKAADAAIRRDGTARFGKKNRNGFFAGTIHCPTSNAGAVRLPARESGKFAVFPFSLPFSTVVNRVSILVDTASSGFVLIGVYDASGKKRCEGEIDLSRVGPATGIFPNTINLDEGDYFLAWGTDLYRDAEVRGVGVIDQFNLLNASGTALMGTARWRGEILPEILDAITPNTRKNQQLRPHSIYEPTYAPILACFKA